MAEDRKMQGVQVISRAADILRVLGRDDEGKSLARIANRVGLPRSTVQRIIGALSAEGLVAPESENGGYRLGPEIQRLANASRSGLRDRMKMAMRIISKETGETVDLAILKGNSMLFIDQVVGTHRLRAVSSIGENFPLTDTANGKAALACLDPEHALELITEEIDEAEPVSPCIAKVLNDIETARSSGIAFDENEHTEGICALGIALPDEHGDVLALSVPIPQNRYFRIKDELTNTLASWKNRLAEGQP